MTYSPANLRRFCAEVYRALGVTATSAEIVADALVQADLWGHQSHGVMRTFWYAKRIQSGATDIASEPEICVDSGAVVVLDGRHGIGQVVANRAVELAIERAKQFGMASVSVRHSGHFGTAMYFSRQAAQAGCVGFISTNASAAMAPWGGREKRIGNNPWSIAAPAGRYPPMMLDIANTAVARGKLYLAKQRGEAIPEGWAIDSDGMPTTDPAAGIAGNILPFAGHKGYAISVMMDVLSGVLSGSQFANAVVGPYVAEGQSGVGHMVTVYNIDAFRSLAEFNADMEAYIDTIKATPRAPGQDAIYYPGEMESIAEQRNLDTGIEIPEATVEELNAGAHTMGCSGLA
ncbi:MAG: Ldh family oxidoreductase [Pseudomonadota bacterium]